MSSSAMNKESKIYVAGHRGMVGSALFRLLKQEGYKNLVTRTRAELDLCDQAAVRAFMQEEKPDYVIIAAAKVGGIHANNTYPAEFLYENLAVEINLINEAHKIGCTELLFLGSSCIYPKFAKQPMEEEALLSGPLEPTNEPYAIAKIAGIKLCESYNRQYNTDYRSVMPTNLYGPNDNFHPENSHVIPALLRRFHEAKISHAKAVEIWGSGIPRREFLHVDDFARACLFVMQLSKEDYRNATKERCSHINVGYGEDVTIRELAETVAGAVRYEGRIEFDTSKPDGTPRKLMDSSLLSKLGWTPETGLPMGLRDTYAWYLEHVETARS